MQSASAPVTHGFTPKAFGVILSSSKDAAFFTPTNYDNKGSRKMTAGYSHNDTDMTTEAFHGATA